MSFLITGSIGIDTVETPFGKREDVVGGSSIYCAYAASFFTHVSLVGVVGDDCPPTMFDLFKGRNVDLAGLEMRKGSKTFRWHGSYTGSMNEATTVEVDLNVLAERAAKIPDAFRDSTHVFLANTHPALQVEAIASLRNPKLIVADTMNLWIQTQHPDLLNLLKKIDGLVLNDGEARLLTGQTNLVAAARQVLAMGPKFVIVKKGEHGSLLVSRDDAFVLPAYPTEQVVDPTGAGDSFAGGMMGYLATQEAFSLDALRRAIAYGTVVASFTISDFSLAGLQRINAQAIQERFAALKDATVF